ncbi:MAG: DNA mismatch endonuclease Vsr [Candidatus Hydrogenedentes bacterium]|nr:DNA mismatch endonuclease Vsr [Candidatus Hydrogenedentota bacterium]
MPDVLTNSQRSKCMAAIRSVDTIPEITVRQVSHALGYRFRLHVKQLPGKPDIVFPRYRAVIFVHGCFWHQHRCGDGHIPASRRDYWEPKFARNQKRDREHRRQLRQQGWRVLTIWECQTRNRCTLAIRIKAFLDIPT